MNKHMRVTGVRYLALAAGLLVGAVCVSGDEALPGDGRETAVPVTPQSQAPTRPSETGEAPTGQAETIAALRTELAARDAAITQLAAQIAAFQAELARRDERIAERDRAVNSLSAKLADAEKAAMPGGIKKFAWAPKEWNATVTMTKLEYEVACKGHWKAAEPIKAGTNWLVTAYTVGLDSDGLVTIIDAKPSSAAVPMPKDQAAAKQILDRMRPAVDNYICTYGKLRWPKAPVTCRLRIPGLPEQVATYESPTQYSHSIK